MGNKTNRFKLKHVLIEDIVFTEKNANYMNQDTFHQLVANLKKDGQLSSVPFTILLETGKDKGKYEVISGNHRVKAAQMAGIADMHIMYVEESKISQSEKRALQLSHNSIHGQDDMALLRELVDEITDLDYREYAHIDEAMFDELDKMDYSVIQPTNEVITITFSFFDTAKVDFDRIAKELDTISEKDLENTHLFPKEQFHIFNEVIGQVQERYRLKSYGLGIMRMVELVKELMDKDK